MSALETYLKAIKESYGINRMKTLTNLRRYIKMTPEIELIGAIHTIRDTALLKIIIEAGVSAKLQYVVADQAEKIARGEYK